MKVFVWILALVAVLLVSLADRAPGRSAGHTLLVTFAGLDDKETAVALAGRIVHLFSDYEPVATIARDGGL